MWDFPSELSRMQPRDRMLQEAWRKKTVDWEGQEAGLSLYHGESAKDAGQFRRHNFPCRLPGTREPKRSLAWDPGARYYQGWPVKPEPRHPLAPLTTDDICTRHQGVVPGLGC